jgi:cobalt-zinc-cadmium efflux system membrane fusion protein
MLSRIRPALGRLTGQLPALAVFAGLTGLFAWGHHTDWDVKRLAGSLGIKLGGGNSDKDKKKDADDSPRGFGPVKLDSADSAEKAGLLTAPAEFRPVRRYVTANAQLAFNQTRYAHLSPRAAGAVWKVLKGGNVGQAVGAGEVLALVAAPDVGKAKADFLQALVQVDIRTKILLRLQPVAGSVPEKQLRDARTALREARIRLLADRQALANFELPVRTDQVSGLSDEEAARHLRLLGLPEDLQTGPGADALPNTLLPVRAPFKGMVLRRDVVEGEQVGAAQSMFVLADVANVWILMDVRLEDVGEVRLNQPVSFLADVGGRAAGGASRLTWISDEVNVKTRTVRARAEIENPGRNLRPATFGKARILVHEHRALTVPDEAVQWDAGVHWVFVMVDAKSYQPRLVLPATRDGGSAELLPTGSLLAASVAGQLASPLAGSPLLAAAGLWAAAPAYDEVEEGDPVVTSGSHVLKSEMLKDRISNSED